MNKIISKNFVIICLIVILVCVFFDNNKAFCMDTDYYFNGTYYASFDNMIRAKQNYFYKALAFEDIGYGNRNVLEIKQIFAKLYNHNDRISFNIILNKNNTPQEIAEFAKKYTKFL